MNDIKVINIDNIPVWNKNTLKFEKEIYSDKYKGEIYCIKIEEPEQLKELFEYIFKQEENKTVQFFYRGHRDSNWRLTSSLEREIYKKVKIVVDQERYNKIRNDHLEKFKENGKIWLKDQNLVNDERELWAIGQHLGLKTPYIDWTRNFYNALFFAFEKFDTNVKYRAVYSFSHHLFKDDELIIPKTDYYRRLTAQQGVFTEWGFDSRITEKLNALEKYIENNADLQKKEQYERHKNKLATKFYIANSLRDDVISHLKHIGIDHSTIYPDLMGAISLANDELSYMLENMK
ncbi:MULTISPECIES: FRG domain-containing protein [Rodentibacter]|uniref:FRG domain-containing protein n=1 Tax=Rodentibacter TaxID=1960084 RepID=UPI001CFCCF82|nr:FRG domain-containing protein [Rodentibacter sp. JRC1]GJI55169.1 hypothetical protein HEMROJRC1_02810 [Rodentibacter sp. JRC1]